MKKLISITCFALFALVLFNSTKVKSRSSSAPAGYCNDPAGGGGTCTNGGCHSGGSTADSTTFTLNMGSSATTLAPVFSGMSYTPGTTYTMSFVGNASSPRYGFELTALKSGNAYAGGLTATNTTTTRVNTSGGVGYMGHRNAGTTKNWQFSWTAPSAGSGDVTFYCLGMNSNGNGSSSGDNVFYYTKVLHESTSAAPPVASFTGSPLSGTANSTLFTFTDASTGTPTSWNWTFTPNNVSYQGGTGATSTNPQVMFTAAGTYTVKMVVSNATGTDSMTRTSYVTVNPNAINEVVRASQGVNVYPTPAHGTLNIDIADNGTVKYNTIALYDLAGRMVYGNMLGGSAHETLDITSVPAGVYTLLLTGNDKRYTQTISVK